MLEWLANTGSSWLSGAIGAALTAIAGGAIALIKKRSTRTEVKGLKEKVDTLEQQHMADIAAMRVALRASMYDRLYYLHSKFMNQKWISVQDFENVTGIYDGYHGLGGNGVGTTLYEELKKLPKFEPM